MVQLEVSGSDEKIQALRDRLQGEDNDRRRPGRTAQDDPKLVQLLRGKAVPYRPLSDEIDPPYGLEHTTPAFGTVVGVIVGILHLSILASMAWTILR